MRKKAHCQQNGNATWTTKVRFDKISSGNHFYDQICFLAILKWIIIGPFPFFIYHKTISYWSVIYILGGSQITLAH